MSFSPRLSGIIASTATIAALVQTVQPQPAIAQKTAAEIEEIAEEITVRIDGPGAGGSGFIVKREGNTYTVLTNWHVVDREGNYIVKTSDGRQHQVAYSQIREQPGVDLAVISFTSSQSYRVAELGNSDDVNLTQTVYVSGWLNPLPGIPEPVYTLFEGQLNGVQRPDDSGYALLYSADGIYSGTSGGPVLDQQGKVLGIHGLAPRHPIDGLLGLYLAIPINTFEGAQVIGRVRETEPAREPARETTRETPRETARETAEENKNITSLRGYFMLPELKAQGMVQRLGRGEVREVIALDQELTVVIATGGAALFNLATGEALWEIDCPASGGAVSADGRLLALRRGKDIYLWDLTNGKFLRQLNGHTEYVSSVAISPDGRYLASGSLDNTVRLWDAATGQQLRQFNGHTNDVWSVAISADGRYLASGSLDNTVRLWDAATGQQLRQFNGHTNDVWSVAISADGRYLASGSGDKTVRLWDAATGEQLRQFNGHTSAVRSVAISPDGRYLASGSTDNTARLWDATTGEQLRQFIGHTDEVRSVAISADGRYLASGSWDGVVQLWDVGSLVGHYRASSPGTRDNE